MDLCPLCTAKVRERRKSNKGSRFHRKRVPVCFRGEEPGSNGTDRTPAVLLTAPHAPGHALAPGPLSRLDSNKTQAGTVILHPVCLLFGIAPMLGGALYLVYKCSPRGGRFMTPKAFVDPAWKGTPRSFHGFQPPSPKD